MDYSQILKGILEGCILALLQKEECYGYEMVSKLSKVNLPVAEGSIYPLFLKLQKEKLITATMKSSKEGPMRKYYTLTSEGEAYLAQFKLKWQQIHIAVNTILGGQDETNTEN